MTLRCKEALRPFLLFAVMGVWLSGDSRAAQVAARTEVDLLVKGGTVVTMDAARRIVEDGAVAIRGERIVAVGAAAEMQGRYQPAREIQAAGKIILPGFINT